MRRRCHQPRRRSGVTLLEVIVALTILAMAGMSITASVRVSFDSVERAHAVDREIRSASAFLDAVTLWSRTELDQRLGERRQGAWSLRIDRTTETLYVLTLSDSAHRQLFRTSLFRAAASVQDR